MQVEILGSAEEGADFVAKLALGRLSGGETHNLLVSTGGTFKPIYQRLRTEPASTYDNVRFYNQDEYCVKKANGAWGMIDQDDPQSFRRFMREQLFADTTVPSKYSFFPGIRDRRFAGTYDRMIAGHGGIELALLGLGRNCHLGFNEPGESVSPFGSVTRFVELTPETRVANYDPAINEPVPPAAITVGLGTIGLSRELVVVAFGEHKSPAIQETIWGEVSPAIPSSMLRLPENIGKTLLVVDEAAAAEL